MTDTTKKPLERLAERMERIGDELKVRVHLAGLDAKDAWDRAHLERITDELKKVGDEAKVQMHLANLEAKDTWARVQEKTLELRGKVGASADGVVHDIAHGLGDLARSLRTGVKSGRSADTDRRERH
ncbi:MAG: hypothetical protein M3Y87_17165 [Myxococcota bacterium]|nr:hypothetical protein [Myxococcota bacterium]